MIKNAFLITFFLLCTCLVSAQDMPKIIPPSPEISALFKFIDYPVDYSTGVPQISIPLYDIKAGALQVPISISFHASGRKASDVAGPVGFGWVLNAGGAIGRTIHGKPDEQSYFPSEMKSSGLGNDNKNMYGYLASLYYSNPSGIQYPNNPPVQSNIYYSADPEYDIYSYSFGSNSGKFIYKHQQDSVYLIPEKPYKVSFGTIIDDKGITYQFDQQETYTREEFFTDAVTSKLLTSIISADKTDTIKFTYQYQNQPTMVQTQNYSINDNFTDDYLKSSMNNYGYPTNSTGLYINPIYNTPRLQKIVFKGGSVLFNSNATNNRIDNIQVLNESGNVIRTIQLLNPGGNDVYYLNGIDFKDGSGIVKEKYAFEYYSDAGQGSDYYGYVNSVPAGVPYHNVATDNTGSTWSVGSQPDRNPSIAARGGMIKKIIYPTGGSTEFSYELNMALNNSFTNQAIPSGGLRVSEIKTTDDNGLATYKTYKYGMNENGYGTKQLLVPASTLNGGYEMLSYENRYLPTLDKWRYGSTTDKDHASGSYRKRTYTGDFLPEIAELGNEPVFYPEVTEYNGTIANHNGKTIYRYEGPGTKYQIGQFTNPSYPTQLIQTGANDNLPIWTFRPNGMVSDYNLRRYHISEFNYWMSNPLKEKVIYKHTGGGTTAADYQMLQKDENTYNYIRTHSFRGMHIIKHAYAGNSSNYGIATGEMDAAWLFQIPVFLYDNYNVTSGREELTSRRETVFDGNASVVSVSDYEYNERSLVKKTTRYTSVGDKMVTTYKYPQDYVGQQPYTDMVNTYHIWSPVIEQSVYKDVVDGNHFLQLTKNDYDYWANGQKVTYTTPGIYPSGVRTQQGSGSLEARIVYNAYDTKGNIAEVSKAGGAPVTYLWGYQKQYPVAEVRNARVNEVYQMNFEEGLDFPDWGVTLDASRSHTGKYSGRISNTKTVTGDAAQDEMAIFNNTVLQVNLNGKAKKFRYSGWVYSDGPSADILLFMKRPNSPAEQYQYAYVDAVSTSETGKWVYLEKVFEVPGDVSQLYLRIDNNRQGTVWFDDLRLYPAEGQMTTYTYEPLVGMTSAIDGRGQTTYYEYDNFQRLFRILDAKRHIIKQMDYHYKTN